MASIIDSKEDPLIAALPPASDYLTYLTILEYQLKPDNLPTLNRLLSEDDGTLAAEIGWDLLKIVLPMLQIVPEEANRCLSIIARRGNPREVVVRVAEELERLGADDEKNDVDDFEQDELPTFAGEAPRIHLGDMKLDGMPPPKSPSEKARPTTPVPSGSQPNQSAAEFGSDDILILQALLSMLGILHPRIKTQYPSRFLATSLPAALAAYRRLHVTAETTTAFVDFLSKLSGKQRPALPPRTSTQGSIPTIPLQSPTDPSTPVQAPPLPDPEAKTDPSAGITVSQASEKAITKRLLQAVMLEVLDEYTGSFQETEQPSMSWTIRLREKHEPKRVPPQRPTETQRWAQSAELTQRDDVVTKFLKLGKDLDLNVFEEIHKFVNPTNDEAAESAEQPDTDYPTSPSQIPFPNSGLALLFAAQNFAQDRTGLTRTPPLSLPETQTMFKETFAPVQELVHPPSLAQIDALLSLIYTTLQSPLTQPAPTTTSTSTIPAQPPTTSHPQVDLPFLTNLTNLFTTSPDPQVRDSTHHLTTLILHNHTDPETKLLYIKSLLSPHLSPADPIHDMQQGNLRALAITWLKDEFITSSSTDNTTNNSLVPTIPVTDPDLTNLLFPPLPPPPHPFITSHPTSSPLLSESTLETLLLNIPAYIAALNLIYILSTIHEDTHTHESILSSAAVHGPASRFFTTITAWKDTLGGLAAGIARSGAQDSPIVLGDVNALEDAVLRVKGVFE